MRKHRRFIARRYNKLLISVAVATAPGVGYAVSTDCEIAKAMWNFGKGKNMSADALNDDYFYYCFEYLGYGQEECENAATGEASGYTYDCMGYDDWYDCPSYMDYCEEDTPSVNCSAGYYAKNGTCYKCPTYSLSPGAETSPGGVSGISSCYVPQNETFKTSAGHSFVIVSDCSWGS